jgi:hypothetical protein
MEVLFIHLPSPDTQMGGNFGLVGHAFSTIVGSDSHMMYCGFHTAWRKLFVDAAAFTVFVIFVHIGGQ